MQIILEMYKDFNIIQFCSLDTINLTNATNTLYGIQNHNSIYVYSFCLNLKITTNGTCNLVVSAMPFYH